MKDLEDLLNNFKTHGLKEIEPLGLMRRIDRKYTFHISRLPQILSDIQAYYSCLAIQGRRINHYSTLYFDTRQYQFYRDHHRGKLNRLKIRRRRYVDSGLQFLEIKMKTNTGFTNKMRIISEAEQPELDEKEKNFISKTYNGPVGELTPTVMVSYDRIAFADLHSGERLSMDLNLTFRNKETTKTLEGLVIAELKTDRFKNSNFTKLMRHHHIQPVSFSKYCYALATTEPGIVRNNFKEKIYSIQKHLSHVHIAK